MVPVQGRPRMIIPAFEAVKLEVEGHDVFYDVLTWEETEDPIAHVATTADPRATIAVGEKIGAVFYSGVRRYFRRLTMLPPPTFSFPCASERTMRR